MTADEFGSTEANKPVRIKNTSKIIAILKI